jgi:hypothetical protein
VTGGPSVAELLENPRALLTRTHLRELGLTRTMIDAVFLSCPVVFLPGCSRGAVYVSDYLGLVDRSTHRDNRVRPA